MRAALTAVPLLPVLAVQGLLVRRSVPRLPGAAGRVTGAAGVGEPLRLAVLGESTAAGVGARTHDVALVGSLADELAVSTNRRVHWQVQGRIGATAREVRTDLAPLLDPADVVVVVLGVNDTIAFHSARRWTRDLLALVVELRRVHSRIVLAGVPPMGRFPALPRPLRTVLGLRAAELDAASARLAERVPGVAHDPVPRALLADGMFCEDRFHPGEQGYRRWAEQLAGTITTALWTTSAPSP